MGDKTMSKIDSIKCKLLGHDFENVYAVNMWQEGQEYSMTMIIHESTFNYLHSEGIAKYYYIRKILKHLECKRCKHKEEVKNEK
jgi:hypothetical protein